MSQSAPSVKELAVAQKTFTVSREILLLILSVLRGRS